MNYLEQIVAFHRWKEVNPLPASAIALWFELMAVCNKAGWPEEFTVPNAVVQSTAGLSRKEFDRARQMLIDLGRLSYKKSQRVNNAGKYTLIPFSIVQKGQQSGQQKGQREGQPEVHREEHGRDNERDISLKDLKDKPKPNKTKEDNPPISPKGESDVERDEAFETWYGIYPKAGSNRKTAFEKWKVLWKAKKIEMDAMINGTKAYLAYQQHHGYNTCAATVFLNQERWLSDWTIVAVNPPQSGTRGYIPRQNNRPPMKVVKDDGQAPEVTPEQMERMLARARELKTGSGGHGSRGID